MVDLRLVDIVFVFTGVAGFPVADVLVPLAFLLLWPQIICLV